MKILRLLGVASAAFFIASSASAQNAGTVTSHAFAIGKGAGHSGYTSLLCGSAQLAVGQSAADPICKTITGDVTISAAGVTAIGTAKVTAAMIATMTSSQFAGVMSDETGGGALVFGTSPTLASPTITDASTVANSTAPASPSAGNVATWADSTDLRFHDKNASGVIGTTAVGYSSVAHQFLTGMNANGTFAGAQPAFTDISGQATLAQLPTIGASTVLGSIAGGTPIALTTAQHTSLVNTFTTSLSGAVPPPGTVASKFLRDDGTWQSVAGAGTVTSVACNGLTITASGTCPEPFGIENCTLSASVASNLLTVALKDNSGADPSATSPCRIGFRSATATSGTPTFDNVTAALSINTNATGATLGSANSKAFRLWVVAFDNAGTVVLSLYNATSVSSTLTQICPIDETQVQSSTGISGSATSACVYYTPNGTTLASKAIRILGYVEYNSTGLTTAGTYATSPNFVQTMGLGIKKPGDTVQKRISTTTTPTTVTTSTRSATGASTSITITSAANPIHFTSSGTAKINSTAVAGDLVIGRGSCSTVAGGAALFTGVAGNSNAPFSVGGFDSPNLTGATSYTLCIANDAAGTGTFVVPADNISGFTSSVILIIEEIMG